MRTLALTVLLLACAPAYAQIYKCVDARGVTQYSDKPVPPSCKGGAVKIRATPPTGTGGQSVPPAAGTAAEINRCCARMMQEHKSAEPGRREELREQARGCA